MSTEALSKPSASTAPSINPWAIGFEPKPSESTPTSGTSSAPTDPNAKLTGDGFTGTATGKCGCGMPGH